MNPELADKLETLEDEKRNLYQSFSRDEEIERVSYHYEIQPEFFQILTGGKWNTYSCNIFEQDDDLTRAQQRKLDQFARLLKLKPGDRLLDVGCGWGGPLVYLCKHYGVRGHGITISPMAIPIAESRAKQHGVDARFSVLHWEQLEEVESYDAIMTDEVIVHFHDLQEFFAKCFSLLKPEGRLVNKELHFKNSRHAHARDKLSQHINKVYGYSGNYRVLQDELDFLDKSGFLFEEIVDIPIEQYKTTISKHWIPNLINNAEFLKSLTSEAHFRQTLLYLKGILKIFHRSVFGLHMVAASKPQ